LKRCGGAAVLAGIIVASRAEGVPVPNAPDPILDAIEAHRYGLIAGTYDF
jgi:hypothetical protein